MLKKEHLLFLKKLQQQNSYNVHIIPIEKKQNWKYIFL